MPFITIKIPKFNTRKLEASLQTTLRRRGRRNENILLRTTQYFDRVKPVFTSQLEKVGGEWEITTGPEDDEFGRIWGFLDQGTDIRYAFMNEDFAAGTTPGTFVTEPKLGQKVGLSTNNPPEEGEDGIEARLWTELLVEEEVEPYGDEMQGTVTKWLKNFGEAASRFISG